MRKPTLLLLTLATLSTTPLPAADAPAPAVEKATSPEDADLLAARRAVWVAWFGGDRKALERALPADALYIGPGARPWVTTAQTLDSSQGFAKDGGKLVRLEFPRTEIRRYGDTAILYTTYVYEIESKGEKSVEEGKGVEVFVKKDGRWIHPTWMLAKEALGK